MSPTSEFIASCRVLRSATEKPRRADNELHFVVDNAEDFRSLLVQARQSQCHLCTLVVADERSMEADAFKLYGVLSVPVAAQKPASHPERPFGSPSRSLDESPAGLPAPNCLMIVEYPLRDNRHPGQYPSIQPIFPSAQPLEREALDLFGVSPYDQFVSPGALLHGVFPPDLHPLWTHSSQSSLKESLVTQKAHTPAPPPDNGQILPEGMLILPVGPIHAGVIEAGHFRFRVAGEVIEDLDIVLGYKHKGIEKLFEARPLDEGCALAERVSGDSSCAHALAYCQAVESLADMTPPARAQCWRAVFVELERIYNHIGVVAAMVHDMAFDMVSSELSVLREKMVRLNHHCTGSRLLRGANCLGGVSLQPGLELAEIEHTVAAISSQFLALSKAVLEKPDCRNRMFTTGKLTEAEARENGATGLVARACGMQNHDFRLIHPYGAYATIPGIRNDVYETFCIDQDATPSRGAPIFTNELRGDVYARMAVRIAEVETSAQIVRRLLDEIRTVADAGVKIESERLARALRAAPNYTIGLGYVEGWRGDIFYWVMKGPGNTIFRCKVRDPSVFNWPLMRLAVVRKPDEDDTGRKRYWENILADFPLINKSFNLSYSGNDG